MARMRSPSYPSIPLRQAVDLAAKVHRSCRTNVIDRATAAREMGYSGLTGRSLKVLAALIQFGLLTKAGKGDVKVTQTTVDILHGIDQKDRDDALVRAGLAPTLFRDIHDRFPEGIPSENAIRSFLIQQEFADVAIGPAINAFMETYHWLQDIRESESHCVEGEDAPESAPDNDQEAQMQTGANAPLNRSTPPDGLLADSTLNKINMNIEGDRVTLSGVLDIRGIRLLEKKITGLKALLSLDEEDEENDEGMIADEDRDPRD